MDILEIKSRRVKLKLTQNNIAQKLGVAVTTYTKKENGKIPFSRDELCAMKKILDLDDSDFIKIFFEN